MTRTLTFFKTLMWYLALAFYSPLSSSNVAQAINIGPSCADFLAFAHSQSAQLNLTVANLKQSARDHLHRLKAAELSTISDIPNDFPLQKAVEANALKIIAVNGQIIRVFDFNIRREAFYTIDGYSLEENANHQKVRLSGPYLIAVRAAKDSPSTQDDDSTSAPRELLVADTRRADPDGAIPASAVIVISLKEYDPESRQGGNYIRDFQTLGPYILIDTSAHSGTNANIHTLVALNSTGQPLVAEMPNRYFGRISMAYDDQNLILNLGQNAPASSAGPSDLLTAYDPKTLDVKGPIKYDFHPLGYDLHLRTVTSSDGARLLIIARGLLEKTDIEIVNLDRPQSIFHIRLDINSVMDMANYDKYLFLAGKSGVKYVNLETRNVRKLSGTKGTKYLSVRDGSLNLFKDIPGEGSQSNLSKIQLVKLPLSSIR